MFFKAVPAALLLVYYCMCTWNGYDPVIRYFHAACLTMAGALVWGQISYAKKHNIFDEFARENLKTTDSICLKLAYVLMVIAALACVFADFNGMIAGYFVVGGILHTPLKKCSLTADDGASPPLKWCTNSAEMVHGGRRRGARGRHAGNHSGMPLRLRMDSPSIWMV